MNELILVGGGGHCRAVIDVIEQQNSYKIAGIVDKYQKEPVLGYPVLGGDDDLPELAKSYHYALVCVGQIKSAELRIKLYTQLKSLGFKLPIITSPFSYISKHSSLGEGTVVLHHAHIGPNCTVGVNCIINTKSSLEHDAVAGNHCHISTAAIVNGGVTIGNNVFLGSNSTCCQEITIADNTFVKAHSLVK